MHSGFLSYGCYTAKEMPIHRNQGMELVYVEQGHLRWLVDGKTETIHSGSVFFTLPWQAHGSQYAHEPGNIIHFVLARLDKPYPRPRKVFRFHPSLQVPRAEAEKFSRLYAETKKHTWVASAELKWLLQTLVRCLGEDSDPFQGNALFMAVLAELAVTIRGHRVAMPTRTILEDRVEKLFITLKDRSAEEWNLPRMVRESGVAKSKLSTIFKDLTGDSPLIYLKRLRIERAESFLLETDFPITDIAEACGFPTSQLFARLFRQFTNQTPSAYRTSCRDNHEHPVLEWNEEEERRRFQAIGEDKWL